MTPDISMCMNDKCPLKTTCYRYMAIPSPRQTYAAFTYNDGCDDYWEYNVEYNRTNERFNRTADLRDDGRLIKKERV